MKKSFFVAIFLMVALVSVWGQLNVSLSPNSPNEISTLSGSVNVPLVKLNFTNTNQTGGSILINDIQFSFSGQYNENTITNARIMLHSMQISESNDDPINDGFGVLSTGIQPGTTQEITLVVNFSDFENTASIAAGLSGSNSITAVNQLTGEPIYVTGELPFYGNPIHIIMPSLGVGLVQQESQDFTIEQQNVELFKFCIQTNQATEVLRIIITNTGTPMLNNSLGFLRLTMDGEQMASAPLNAEEKAIFMISIPPLDAQRIYHFSVICNISSWATSGQTIRLTINDSEDILALAIPSGQTCQILGDFPITGNTHNIISNQANPWLRTFPERNPITIWNGNESSTTDSIYVLPYQTIYGSSWMEATESVVGVQFERTESNNMNSDVTMTNALPTPGNLVTVHQTDHDILSWVADSDSSGTTWGGLSWYGFTNTDSDPKWLFQSLRTTYISFNGFYHEFITTNHFNHLVFIPSNGIWGDFNGNGFFEHTDIDATQVELINFGSAHTECNPQGQNNIARTRVAVPWDTIVNVIYMNWGLNNPNLYPYLHLGQSITYDQTYQTAPIDYEENDGSITINTDANCAGVIWTNPNGTTGNQTMIFRGSECRSWRNDIDPETSYVSRNGFTIQLPNGARLISVQAIVLPENTPIDDTTIPAIASNLGNAYPNPFHSETSINYSTPKTNPVIIDIFNSKGQKVKTLVNETKGAGNHSIVWNGTDQNNKSVSNGVYYYRMTSGKYTASKKIILIK